MLSLMLRPLIRERSLVHDKYYRPSGVDTVPLLDPKSHFGASHQNIKAVLKKSTASEFRARYWPTNEAATDPRSRLARRAR